MGSPEEEDGEEGEEGFERAEEADVGLHALRQREEGAGEGGPSRAGLHGDGQAAGPHVEGPARRREGALPHHGPRRPGEVRGRHESLPGQ